MDSISFTEAVADFAAVVDRVIADRAPLGITDEQGRGVVLVPVHEGSAIEQMLFLGNR